MLDTSSGETLWYYDLRDIVAWLDFSPRQLPSRRRRRPILHLLVDVSSGRKIWQIPMYSFHGRFTANGSLILIDNYLFDLKGNEIGHLFCLKMDVFQGVRDCSHIYLTNDPCYTDQAGYRPVRHQSVFSRR
ncbi:MAG: hypothetical protein CM1200mP27_08420 [Chloroflexota bacterium]|nr:MAG: hypothetical protein CM1200mP27_08420 [Chloroflexota bacterium]